MDADKPEPREEHASDGLKEWETPELIVEDVHSATQGGFATTNPQPDDGWYAS